MVEAYSYFEDINRASVKWVSIQQNYCGKFITTHIQGVTEKMTTIKSNAFCFISLQSNTTL